MVIQSKGGTAENPPETEKHFKALIEGWGSRPGIPAFLFGILLPAIALGVELSFRMCREIFFNPLPDPLHIALVALVPLANLILFIALRRGEPARPRGLAFLSGAAVGISAFYSLLFIPLYPIGLIAVIYFGFGLLILAPALALVSSWSMRRHLHRNLTGRPRGFWPGLAAALGLLVVVELPSTLTRVGMGMAASSDEGESRRGIGLLRIAGDRDLMLRYCYGRISRVTDLPGFLFSFGTPVDPDKAKAIHYRVLGEAYNSHPAPEDDRPSLWDDSPRWRGWDDAQGGTAVAGGVPGLSMAASRLDASIDARAALAYQEWTLEFRNESDVQAEARAQIHLPPEGVVSRLTLWVDGEEREAAFAGRSQVRQAYERVVSARRDPVLVTTQGKDRVLMQCFPVPPRGGRMKVRLGITSPLAFSASGEAHFHLPRFAERNFGVTSGGEDAGQSHSLWLEADAPFLPPGTDWTTGLREEDGRTVHTLRGKRGDAWLSEGRSIAVGEGGGNHAAWSSDARLGADIVRQWAEPGVREPLGELLVVVDGSKGMKPYLKEVAAGLRAAERPIRVFLAAEEEVREYAGPAQRAGDWLERQPTSGGQDNLPALMRAWEQAPDARKASLLWIHAAQPVLLSSPEILRQGLERQAYGPRVLSLQVGNGPDRLLEDLASSPMVAPVRFSGGFREELASLVSPTAAPQWVLKRKRAPRAHGSGQGLGKQTSDHLARLLAHEEILALLRKGDETSRGEAVAAAGLFQLVTPASGAVVLENQAQYAEAGLEPSSPATVPGIPEPETVAMLVVLAFLLGAGALKSRFARLRRKPA